MNLLIIQISGFLMVIALMIGAVLLGIYSIRYLRSAGSRELVAPNEMKYLCVDCHSDQIAKTTGSIVSPISGFICMKCEYSMRSPKTGYLYSIFLILGILSLSFLVIANKNKNSDQMRIPVLWVIASIVVPIYSFMQLLRKTPKLVTAFEAEQYRKEIEEAEAAKRVFPNIKYPG